MGSIWGIRLEYIKNLFRGHKVNLKPELIVVGMGNPGPDYAASRHNVGFWLIDSLAEKVGVRLSRTHKTTYSTHVEIHEKLVVLARPRTYVNRTGEAISYLLNRYGVHPTQLVIVYDDIHLPVGKLRIRAKGSAGGHNGIRSVISAIDSNQFPRIRIGVGSPEPEDDQIGYVLGVPDDEDRSAIEHSISVGIQAISTLLCKSVDTVMSEYN